jgi:hypothetical protein
VLLADLVERARREGLELRTDHRVVVDHDLRWDVRGNGLSACGHLLSDTFRDSRSRAVVREYTV